MDEEPKCGLMLSLVLMNLTAVALFFLAATSPKKQAHAGSPQHPQVTQVEVSVAGDTKKNMFDDSALPLPNSGQRGTASLPLEMADTRSPWQSIRLPEIIHGSVEVGVLRPSIDTSKRSREFPAAGNAEPPLATALKSFVINSKLGAVRLFEGLKNGYTEKRVEERASAEKGLPGCESRELLDSWIWGSSDEGSQVNQETVISTEIVMDVLSKTQKRTNELIDVFSKKVVPAIERMNDRVAEAIRLEKNLDTYTSTLIRAIDSVVCPPVDNANLDNLQSGTNAIRKSRQGKRSDLSLVQYSPKHDPLGSFSNGERCESRKIPVFKTLTARCMHRQTKRSSKTKGYRRRCDGQEGNADQLLQVERESLDVDAELSKFQQTGLVTNGNDQGHNVGTLKENGLQEETRAEQQGRTIYIEDVLALTSSMEQSYDQDIRLRSDIDFTFDQSALSSDLSMSSGMGVRSHCMIENLKHDSAYARTGEHSALMLPVNQSLDSASPQQVGSLTSDCTVVCNSRIRGFDSYLARQESSTIAYVPGKEHRTESRIEHQDRGHSITSGNNTNDIVKVFKRLDPRGKEIAMENVCLLVLRIFEAWSESQQPSNSISPLATSKMSLSSWASKDEMSLGQNRPRTAIFKSTIMDSVPEQPMANVSHQADDTLPDVLDIPQTTSKRDVTEISRSLVQCVAEAAEVQIFEQSLKGLKTNMRTSRKDRFLASADTANPSGFGDTKKDSLATENENVSLACKSHDSITEASKESSSATFYTDQPESSEDAFYECISTISAGTFGSLELEDSSKLFLERIQEEETKVREQCNEGAAVDHPQTAHSSFSFDSWLNDSGEELRMAKEEITSLDFSDNSSIDVGCGTDDEFPSTSLDDYGADSSQKDKRKKMKWGVKLLKKLLKKKSKPSTLKSPALPNAASRSQSDSAVLKLSDPNIAKSVDEQAQ